MSDINPAVPMANAPVHDASMDFTKSEIQGQVASIVAANETASTEFNGSHTDEDIRNAKEDK